MPPTYVEASCRLRFDLARRLSGLRDARPLRCRGARLHAYKSGQV